jgi:YVTN family beta-propeller protein
MREKICNEESRGHTIIILSGITALTLLMLINVANAAQFAYIPNINSNNVSVIDIENNMVVTSINVGSYPFGVAVSPDGKKAYVTNVDSDSVSVIDTPTHTVTATVPLVDSPYEIAINPQGTKVYVTSPDSNNVSVIDTANNTVIATMNVGSYPVGIAISPDGTKVYVTNWMSNNVSVIDTANNTVIAMANIGTIPFGIAVNPDGKKAYVTSSDSNNVSVIDTTNNTIVASVDVGTVCIGIAVSPDGTKAYVTNPDSNNVSVIDTASNTVIATMSVGRNPSGIAVNQDGTKACVANFGSNSVSLIDTAINTVTATLPVGKRPFASGQFIGPKLILPIANFSTNVTHDYPPLSVQFNDSSENATGWNWDFGDGANSTEQNPRHTYSTVGNYTVNLKATNENGTTSDLATIAVLDPLSYTIDKTITHSSAETPEGIVTAAGDIITYHINVTNNGKIDLNNVSINVSNSSLNLTRLNSSINEDEIFNIGESWTYETNYTVIQADINDNGNEGDSSIKNKVTVDCDEVTLKSYTIQVPLVRNPQYSIFKSVISPDKDGDCIVNSAGDKIPYRIVVKNEGNVDLTNVTIDDPKITLTGPAGDDNDPEVLNPGERWVYTGNYTLTAADIKNGNGNITNTATVSCNELPEKSSIIETPIDKKADFSIYKSVIGIDEAGDYMINNPGDVISYQVAVRNNGDVKLTGISLNDPMLTLTAPSGDHTDPGVLNPKETWIYTGDYEVTQEDISSYGEGDVYIENTATVSCNELSDESSSIRLRITQKPPTVVTPDSNNSKVPPIAEFSTNITRGYAPLSVQFTDLSQNAVSRSWDFNNDGKADSSNVNPIYTYTHQGTYIAELTSINPNGTDSETTTITVLQAVNLNGRSSNETIHRNGDGFGEAHIIRSDNVSNSSDTGTVTKLENKPQDPEQNKGNTANTEQKSEQTQNTSTPEKERKETPGLGMICGINALLAVFLYRKR